MAGEWDFARKTVGDVSAVGAVYALKFYKLLIYVKLKPMKYEEAKKLLDIYGEAWLKQDPELILTIFTPDAVYDDSKEPENHGHNEIRYYWVNKVIGEQKDIKFKLLNVWTDRNEVIAEWDVEFVDIKRNLRVQMREIGIFTTKDGKFSSLREYYKTTKTPL